MTHAWYAGLLLKAHAGLIPHKHTHTHTPALLRLAKHSFNVSGLQKTPPDGPVMTAFAELLAHYYKDVRSDAAPQPDSVHEQHGLSAHLLRAKPEFDGNACNDSGACRFTCRFHACSRVCLSVCLSVCLPVCCSCVSCLFCRTPGANSNASVVCKCVSLY